MFVVPKYCDKISQALIDVTFFLWKGSGTEPDSFSSVFSYLVHNPVGQEDPKNATEDHEIGASSTSEIDSFNLEN